MEETILMGTNREKAKQLYELLKERQLSVEELEKMVPMQVEFFKELSDVLKKQIDQEKETYAKVVGVYEAVLNSLSEALKDNQISKEERREVLQTICNLGRELKEIQMDKQKRDSDFKKFVMGCLSLLACVLMILAGKKPNNNMPKS